MKKCLNCKKKYDGQGKKYCSLQCRIPWDKGIKRPEIKKWLSPFYGKHPQNQKTGGYKNCLLCSNIFYFKLYQKDTAKFCSRKCTGKYYSKFLSEIKTGKNNASWNGGRSYEEYSVGWTKRLRRYIKERDGWSCNMCKKKLTSFELVVHHKDWSKNNHSVDNLVTLCRSCHGTIHFEKLKGEL